MIYNPLMNIIPYVFLYLYVLDSLFYRVSMGLFSLSRASWSASAAFVGRTARSASAVTAAAGASAPPVPVVVVVSRVAARRAFLFGFHLTGSCATQNNCMQLIVNITLYENKIHLNKRIPISAVQQTLFLFSTCRTTASYSSCLLERTGSRSAVHRSTSCPGCAARPLRHERPRTCICC